jgi:hypothetical protein
MWIYPLPAILAIVGFVYIVVRRNEALTQIRYAIVILIAGLIIYIVRAWRNRDWPFREPLPAAAELRAG